MKRIMQQMQSLFYLQDYFLAWYPKWFP